jgi:hypothetical protein
MNFPTVDVEQADDDLRREVAQFRRVVTDDERARARGRILKVKSIPGERTTAVVRIPVGACL